MLHTNDKALQQYLLGNPLSNNDDNDQLLYICTKEQVAKVMDIGIAKVDDFVLIQGFCVLKKANNDEEGIKKNPSS